ncbi:RING-variant domain protein [Theileria parva strain Muguga]|uniref:RING-variant domain protein n=1 Tax=Theileria parva strain Muguga TaxID=333668 RepID=UPI001C6187A0|nr:RING-variant domain protein [Theileria parva strain Muguga]EAN31709.2 RING-variant domain protein [Theileria parva strain Muguga]
MSFDKSISLKFPHDLTVRWLTYINESTGLLDFEHKNFNRHQLNIRKGFYSSDLYLVSEGALCRIFPGKDKTLSYLQSNNSTSVMVKISCEEGKVFVSSPDPSVFNVEKDILRLISDKACKRIFGHFKAASSLPIALNEGDEIRLGRAKLTVRHLAYNSSLPLSYLHDLISDEPETNPSENDPDDLNSARTNLTVCVVDENANNLKSETDSTNNNRSAVSNADSTSEVMPISIKDDPLVSLRNTDVDLNSSLNKDSKKFKDGDNPSYYDILTTRTNLTSDSITKVTENLENTCRICLCNDDGSGPLITPCKCKGSLTYVHLSCIRSWIKGRLNCYAEGAPNTSFFWQKLTCELCGTLYPTKISIDNKEHDFVDIEQPQPPYLVLEPENVTEKGYFIVSLSNNPAIIGRGHLSDIRLTDISVSRHHSTLLFQNDRFIIKDTRSKFGTLINSSRDTGFKTQLYHNNPVLLKIGNGILCISIKKSFRPFFCLNSYPQQTNTFSL